MKKHATIEQINLDSIQHDIVKIYVQQQDKRLMEQGILNKTTELSKDRFFVVSPINNKISDKEE